MFDKRQEIIRKWEQLTLVKMQMSNNMEWKGHVSLFEWLSILVARQLCHNMEVLCKETFLVLREPIYYCIHYSSGWIVDFHPPGPSTYQILAANLAKQWKKIHSLNFVNAFPLKSSLEKLNCYYDEIRFYLSTPFYNMNRQVVREESAIFYFQIPFLLQRYSSFKYMQLVLNVICIRFNCMVTISCVLKSLIKPFPACFLLTSAQKKSFDEFLWELSFLKQALVFPSRWQI